MAKLKLNIDGDLPDEAKKIFTAGTDGGYEVDLDLLGDIGKLDDFRSNNRELHRKTQQLTADQDDLKADLSKAHDRVKALESQLDGTKKGSDRDKSDLETRLSALEESNKALIEANAAKDKALAAEKDRADQGKIRTDLSEALLGAGVKDTALGDALAVATPGWQVDGDAIKLYQTVDGTSTPVLSDDNAGQPLTAGEFAVDFLKKRPHFGAESHGDGGGGGRFKNVNGYVYVDPNDPVAKGLAEQKYGADKIRYTE